MCIKRPAEQKVAKKDIMVYKLLRKNNTAVADPLFRYEMGENRPKNNIWLSSFRSKEDAEWFLGRRVCFGGHAVNGNDLKIIEMAIPKGSRYMEGDLDFFISSELQRSPFYGFESELLVLK